MRAELEGAGPASHTMGVHGLEQPPVVLQCHSLLRNFSWILIAYHLQTKVKILHDFLLPTVPASLPTASGCSFCPSHAGIDDL